MKPPKTGEWTQINKSVRQAIKHYPDLREYTLCLPVDRPDARLEGRISMMDQWHAHVLKWQRLAERPIRFHYWGEHEIADRLSRAQHAGRRHFWFNAHLLGPDWFADRFADAKANAGPRYSPELNVELEISSFFDALVRHPRFIHRIRRRWGIVRRELALVIPVSQSSLQLGSTRSDTQTRQHGDFDTQDDSKRASRVRIAAAKEVEPYAISATLFVNKVAELTARLGVGLPHAIPFDGLLTELENLRLALENLDKAFERAKAAAGKLWISDSGSSRRSPIDPDFLYSIYGAQRSRYRSARRKLEEFRKLCDGKSARLANTGQLLITGKAGTGKTHLLCDVCDRAIQAAEPCLVILGEQLERGSPWPQIMHQLQLEGTGPETFLGALSAAAQAVQRRALILVDALNEGEGRQVWNAHLAGFLETIKRFPWVAVAVSVRSSYVELVVPEAARKALVRITHHGFAEKEVAATRRFFDAYGLERPNFPLLSPEFANPLFLKLFCSGLVNRGLKRMPLGLEGITAVFDFFLASVQEKLAHPNRLDYDARDNIVERAVAAIAKEMHISSTQWVSRERAHLITESVRPSTGFHRSLLRYLLSEGVLAEEIIRQTHGERVEAIRFSYERLADHRLAALILEDYRRDQMGSEYPKREEKHLRRIADSSPVGGRQPLGLVEIINSAETAALNQGILEALAVQMPEVMGKELLEVVPTESFTSLSKPVIHAFLESLEWRRPDAVGATARRIVEENLRANNYFGARIRDLVISATSQPSHPLNADYLHESLVLEPMARRDTWWSTHTSEITSYYATPLGRLIDWAWTAGREPQHSDEVILLVSSTLTWALSTPDGVTRDRATKALVSILHRRPVVLQSLLRRFQDVDDVYIVERLFAIAYGCALRGLTAADLEQLARYVFGVMFAAGKARPHLLMRDYARGIVELAAARGLVDDLELARARPPYHSEPPEQVPSLDELRQQYPDLAASERMAGHAPMWSHIFSHTDERLFEWTSRSIVGPYPLSRRSQYEAFLQDLPPRLRAQWDEISQARAMPTLLALPDSVKSLAGDKGAERNIAAEVEAFRKELPPDLVSRFDRVGGWQNEPAEVATYDLKYARRWVFHRIIALGWTADRFAGNSKTRHQSDQFRSKKNLGIADKYRRVAWYELLARIADNFEFRPYPWKGGAESYSGPWYSHRREIDPSYLCRTGPGADTAEHTAWWQPVAYGSIADWRSISDDSNWIATTEDLPAIGKIVSPIDSRDASRWLWLRGDIDWREPEPPEERQYEHVRRSIRYWISAVIVRADERKRLVRSTKGVDLSGLRIHELSTVSQVFLGEYPWAPAFCTQYPDKNNGWGLLDPTIPISVLRPAVRYVWESGPADQSIDRPINFSIPAAPLLAPGRDPRNRKWPCSREAALFHNPSLAENGPDVLLANGERFRTWLRRNRFDIVWLMTGEKLLIGGDYSFLSKDWRRLEVSAVGYFSKERWIETRVAVLYQRNGKRVRL